MAIQQDDRSRAGMPSAVATGADLAARGDRRLARNAGDTLPPTPLAAWLAAGGADLLVLSTDEQLVDTVAAREQRATSRLRGRQLGRSSKLPLRRRVAPSCSSMPTLFGAPARARLIALDVYSHKVVTLVAADRLVAEGLMGLLSERKIHRLLIKPPALGITRLLIDSALSRCLQLPDLVPAPAAPRPPRRCRAAAREGCPAPCAAAVMDVRDSRSGAAHGRRGRAGVSAVAAPGSGQRRAGAGGTCARRRQSVVAEAHRAANGRSQLPSSHAPRGVVRRSGGCVARQRLRTRCRGARRRAARRPHEQPTRVPRGAARAGAACSARSRRCRRRAPSRGLPPSRAPSSRSLLTIARARIQRRQLLEPAGESAASTSIEPSSSHRALLRSPRCAASSRRRSLAAARTRVARRRHRPSERSDHRSAAPRRGRSCPRATRRRARASARRARGAAAGGVAGARRASPGRRRADRASRRQRSLLSAALAETMRRSTPA